MTDADVALCPACPCGSHLRVRTTLFPRLQHVECSRHGCPIDAELAGEYMAWHGKSAEAMCGDD